MTFPPYRDPVSPLNNAIETLYNPALELDRAIHKIVLACFDQSAPPACARSQDHHLIMTKNQLSAASVTARAELEAICDTEEFELLVSSERNVNSLKVSNMCSFMISRLQRWLKLFEALWMKHKTYSLSI